MTVVADEHFPEFARAIDGVWTRCMFEGLRLKLERPRRSNLFASRDIRPISVHSAILLCLKTLSELPDTNRHIV